MKHPDVCLLQVSVSLLENELNKEGTLQTSHAAKSKQTLTAAQA
jgi:hypothetical protein